MAFLSEAMLPMLNPHGVPRSVGDRISTGSCIGDFAQAAGDCEGSLAHIAHIAHNEAPGEDAFDSVIMSGVHRCHVVA